MVIFEGIMAFVDKKLRDIMDLKVFVDTDPDVCLARRYKYESMEVTRKNSRSGAVAEHQRIFVVLKTTSNVKIAF